MGSALDRIENILHDDGDAQAKPKTRPNWRLQGMTLALMLVTGYFTWEFLWNTIADKQFGQIIALGGLAAFDLGALLWAGVWKEHSSNESQDGIARALFFIDVSGMLLTTLAGVVGTKDLPAIVSTMTPVILAVIIVVNVVAKFEYDNQSDGVKLAREYRKQAAINKMSQQKAQQALDFEAQALDIEEQALNQAQILATRKAVVAQLKLQVSAMEHGVAEASASGEHINEARQAAGNNLRAKLSSWTHKTNADSQAVAVPSRNGHGDNDSALPNP